MSAIHNPEWLYLAPAYGRRYPTVEAARADWDAGKDFRVMTGQYRDRYTSIRDMARFANDGYTMVVVYADPTLLKSFSVETV